MRIVVSILLGICARHDLQSKKIPAIWIWIYLGITSVYKIGMIAYGKSSVKELLLCLFPGITLLFFAYIGRQVGSGDGWLIIASGLYLRWEELIEVLCYSFMAAGLFSVGYLLFVHKNRKDRIPFVPFLFLGTMALFLGDLL